MAVNAHSLCLSTGRQGVTIRADDEDATQMTFGATETAAQTVLNAHGSLRSALDGLDYCLDWRASPGDWSAREIALHLLARARSLNRLVVDGPPANAPVFTFPVGKPSPSPEEREQELASLLAELEAVATETARLLAGKARHRLGDRVRVAEPGLPSEMTIAELVAVEYREHWREHVHQLSETRVRLGL